MFLSTLPSSLKSNSVRKAFEWFSTEERFHSTTAPLIYKWAWLCLSLGIRCRLLLALSPPSSLSNIQPTALRLWSEIYDPIDRQWLCVSFNNKKPIYKEPLAIIKSQSILPPLLILATEYSQHVSHPNAISAFKLITTVSMNTLTIPIVNPNASVILTDVTLRYSIPLSESMSYSEAVKHSSAYKSIRPYLVPFVNMAEKEESNTWIHEALSSLESSKKRSLKAFQHIFITNQALGKYQFISPTAEPILTKENQDDLFLLSDVVRVFKLTFLTNCIGTFSRSLETIGHGTQVRGHSS